VTVSIGIVALYPDSLDAHSALQHEEWLLLFVFRRGFGRL
jgi:hypothetical protein